VSSEAIKGIFGARGDPPAAAVQPAPSIFVATPCYGGQTTCSYTLACIQLQSLADQFVAAGKDVIAGTYPRKKIYWNNVRMALQVDPDAPDEMLEHAATRFSFKPVGEFPREIGGTPIECEHVTTGFMCIKREVIEKLIRGSEYLEYNVPDAKTDVRLVRYKIFDTGISPSTNELLGEDYWFCERAREAGFKVWLQPDVQLTHTGTYVFRGSLPLTAKMEDRFLAQHVRANDSTGGNNINKGKSND
jgi:hypothetical protein